MIYRPLWDDSVGNCNIQIQSLLASRYTFTNCGPGRSLLGPCAGNNTNTMASRNRTQCRIPIRDFNSPETISKIYEIAYVWGETVPSVFSILPPYLAAFCHHLSTTNIPSDDDNNIDLSLVRACCFAFGKGVSALHGVSGTEALWEDILTMTDTVLSWARYFFRSLDMSTGLGDNPALENGNLSCIAYLFYPMGDNKQFRLSLSSEPDLIKKIVHLWLALTLHGYQSAYHFRALMAGLCIWEDTMPIMAEALSQHDMENVATVLMKGIIEDQSRPPQKYTDYIREATLITFCGGTSEHPCECLVARKSIMWCCRAIRILVSKPKRYSQRQMRV
ncbi:hypothetical protein EV421DRAFT_1352917 [Armillaria borealis]|uniref:Uncharacterized protein n=1 Tax=Armillaria borealis TaxID=47425 RepID=A0AA39J170_9AGAR|nr:hypothetical protein EV421DRAFT_1352917 [Armillaria borealis]